MSLFLFRFNLNWLKSGKNWRFDSTKPRLKGYLRRFIKTFYMHALLEGISLGLLLCIMVGPIFFTILQVSIEGGFRAGFVLAGGQWLGDLMYIGIMFLGAQYIDHWISDEASKANITWYLGSFGGLVLAIFGLSLLLSRAKLPEQTAEGKNLVKFSLWGLGLRGFLINTINPFPLFFWASLMGNALVKDYSDAHTFLLFFGVMGTVIATDLIKVYLAKGLSRWIKAQHLIYVRRIAGLALLAFSLILVFNTR
jgi:threonine/homoserine/homoserine lactone efflux protein